MAGHSYHRDIENYIAAEYGVRIPWARLDRFLVRVCSDLGLRRDSMTIVHPVVTTLCEELCRIGFDEPLDPVIEG